VGHDQQVPGSLPLYRLEQQAARSGVPLARSTLAEWVGRVGYALEPLWLRLGELLRESEVLHADETPVASRVASAFLFMHAVTNTPAEPQAAFRSLHLGQRPSPY
jgi:hypothetical protein